MAARRSASAAAAAGAKRRLSHPPEQPWPPPPASPSMPQQHRPPPRRSRRLSEMASSPAQKPSLSSSYSSAASSEFRCTETPFPSSTPPDSHSQQLSHSSANLTTPDLDRVAASGSSNFTGRGRGRSRGRGRGKSRAFTASAAGEAPINPPVVAEDTSRDLDLEREPILDQPEPKRLRSSDVCETRPPETSHNNETLICSIGLEQETPRETASEVRVGTEEAFTAKFEDKNGGKNVELPLPHDVAAGPSTVNYKEESNPELPSGENQDLAGDNCVEMASAQEEPTTGPVHRTAVAETSESNARGHSRRNRAEASRSRFLQIARERAFHFAHFDANADEAPAGARPVNGRRRRGRQVPHPAPEPQPQPQQVDWPGPFSTARQLVQNRALAAAARKNMNRPEAKASLVEWHPRDPSDVPLSSKKPRPSLLDLCLGLLANNADDVVSLEGVPEPIRARISIAFCERRKMNSKALSLFFQGSPSEIRVPDCSQVKETELMEMMEQLSAERLEELYLGLCGRALSEKCLLATICKSPAAYRLRSISLPGAYRLADEGLELLLQSCPMLVHLDITACSFLTNAAMKSVVKYACNTLESLVLDSCSNLNAKTIVHDLVKLQKLQKLSLSEVTGVTDEVVSELSVQLGGQLRTLSLAYCSSLTDAAIAGIGACCSSLQVLNLAHLTRLSDIAVAHITDGLRVLQELDLRRCTFSDEGIAAYVTASGGSLLNLSVNSVQQVGEQTVLALAKHTNTHLKQLDMSFCRSVSDESLGFLADSCPHLSVLKLYGCTQITEKFLKGHRNSNLMVVGL